MNNWEWTVEYHSAQDIQKFCVQHPEWQKFRKSLKGLPTTTKLDKLAWWQNIMVYHYPPYVVQCQVDNYINALRRGGFLDAEYWVIK